MVVSMERWVGKVAVVTGASSGIGAAIVDRLVEHGLQVVGLARRTELITAKAAALTSKKGSLHAFKVDLRNEDDILAAFKWIADQLGPVHILVNSAGLSKEGTLNDGDTDTWRHLLDVNVLALCICTREAIRSMKKHQVNGHVIHMNSVAGHVVPNYPNHNIYPGTKRAISAITEKLRQELNDLHSQIKVSSISPGLVATEMNVYNKNIGPERREMLKTAKFLRAEDVADAVIFMLSTPEHVQVHELIIKPIGEPF